MSENKVDLDRELIEYNARLVECNLKLAEQNCRLRIMMRKKRLERWRRK